MPHSPNQVAGAVGAVGCEAPVAKRARGEPRKGTPAAARFHEWLLKESGIEGLDNLELRHSDVPGAGIGIYARKPLAPGTAVIRVPYSCVLSAEKALASPVGRAARKVAPTCTDEFVLTLWVAVGRSDPEHPFHIYLASLQADGATPLAWPETVTKNLHGTNLGAAITQYVGWHSSAVCSLTPVAAVNGPNCPPCLHRASLSLFYSNPLILGINDTHIHLCWAQPLVSTLCSQPPCR